MSVWSDLFGGAVTGAVASVIGPPTVEAFAAVNGWRIGARPAGNVFELPFDGGPFGVRRVTVTWGETVAMFALRSAARLPAGRLTPEIGYGFLMRNREAELFSWHLFRGTDGEFGFAASFTTLSAGMDAAAFRAICVKLCEEVAFVDGSLHAKGLL